VSALLYHIVPGSQTADQLLAEATLPTELANVTLTVSGVQQAHVCKGSVSIGARAAEGWCGAGGKNGWAS
jgi:uncharacterized surface protein with fasciclin (FAS1) repeats